MLALAQLAGCASSPHSGPGWPSLAPRPGENSAAARLAAIGNCAPTAAPMTALPMPEAPPLPADAEARMAAAERTLAAVASDLPERQAALAKARRPGGDEVTLEAERSRLEAAVLPLGPLIEDLDALAIAISDAQGAAPLLSRIAAARQRAESLAAAGRADVSAEPRR